MLRTTSLTKPQWLRLLIDIMRLHQAPALGMQYQNRRPSAFGFGYLLTAPIPRHLLPVTTSFGDGPRISATEWA